MVELEIGEIFEEAEGAIEGETEAAEAEGIEGEEMEEIEAEAAEASKASKVLGEVVKGLNTLGDLSLPFIKFVMKNAATGAIFFGVTVLLKKIMTKQPSDKKAQHKYKKIKAISQCIQSATELSKKVSDWLQAHKDEMITLEGISVPLISIFVKFTAPLKDVSLPLLLR